MSIGASGPAMMTLYLVLVHDPGDHRPTIALVFSAGLSGRAQGHGCSRRASAGAGEWNATTRWPTLRSWRGFRVRRSGALYRRVERMPRLDQPDTLHSPPCVVLSAQSWCVAERAAITAAERNEVFCVESFRRVPRLQKPAFRVRPFGVGPSSRLVHSCSDAGRLLCRASDPRCACNYCGSDCQSADRRLPQSRQTRAGSTPATTPAVDSPGAHLCRTAGESSSTNAERSRSAPHDCGRP